MAVVALAACSTRRLRLRPVAWCRVVARLSGHPRSGRLVRLAAAGAVVCSVVLPVLELARIVLGWTPGPRRVTEAVLATACYLPLHVRHVWYAARGARPRAGGWTLAVMAVVVLGAVPLVGTGWLTSLHALGVSVLILVRPPWSLPLAAGLVAAPAPLAVAFGDADWAAFSAASVVWRGAAVFVLVWLVGAARRLEAARLALAEEAVTSERVRIDGELQRTLGAALETIAARGGRAASLAEGQPAAAGEELRALVEGSRSALAEARRTARGYQRLSLRAELDTAATLLTAAGIRTRLILPSGDLPQTVADPSRAALRAAVSRLLGDDTARHCWITAARQDGHLRLELRTDGADPTTAQVEVAVA